MTLEDAVEQTSGASTEGPDVERDPADRGAWRPGDREQLAVVAFSHAIQHGYVAVLGIVYPFVLVTFHTSYATLGVILGIAGVLGGLLQGAAGSRFVRSVSTRALLGGQNLGLAACSVLGAVSPGIAVFGVARVLGNLSSWPQHPVGSAHLTERLPQRRGLALAVHTTGGNVGTLLAPLAASAVVAVWSWRWALGGAGAVLALGSLVSLTRVHGRPAAPPAPPVTSGAPAGATVAAPPSVSLRQALRRRQVVAVMAAGIVSAAGRGLGVLTTYVPAYLRSGLHKPVVVVVGLLTTVVSAGAIVGPVLGGHISDRFGRRRVLYTLYGVGAVALAAFALVGANPVALGLVGLAMGAFAYSEQPIRQALFSDSMQDVGARKAFAAYFAVSQSIGSLWMAVLGVIITAAGFRAAFFVMGGSFVVAGLVVAYGCRRPRGPAVAA